MKLNFLSVRARLWLIRKLADGKPLLVNVVATDGKIDHAFENGWFIDCYFYSAPPERPQTYDENAEYLHKKD